MAFLIDDILFAPFKGMLWLAEKIRDIAVEELEDTPEKLKRELLDLQMLFESDEITEEEYKKREENIMTRLAALTKEKKL